jgi:membrane associated rhomboid family serine protease
LPFATVGMIVLNTAVSFGAWSLSGGGWYIATDEAGETVWIVEEMILRYGHGLRPWQWITSNFLHADFLHLLGNMFCLWGFGLVTEGKIGWQRFLAIYFGIGVAQCAVEQTMMIFASAGGSLGASAVIFGLLAMAMVWAPQNEMQCIFLFFVRPIPFDASLYTIATVAVFIQIGTGMFAGLTVTSQLLHLMGAVAGFAVGVVMLKRGWVDCEGWDLFSVWSGKEITTHDEQDKAVQALLKESHDKRIADSSDGQPVSPTPAPSVSAPATWTATPLQPVAEQESETVTALRASLAAADPARAFALFQELASDPLNWPLPEKELLKTISLFHKQSRWQESIPAMVTYLEDFTEQDTKVRLKLAHILIDAAHRPRQALQVLAKLNLPLLAEKEAAMLQKLSQRAEATTGKVAEEAVEDW